MDRLGALCNASRDTAKNERVEGQQRVPVQEAPNAGRVKIRVNGDAPGVFSASDREFEYARAGRLHFHQQRQLFGRLYGNDAPGVDGVADL